MSEQNKQISSALSHAQSAAQAGDFEAAARWAKEAAKQAPHDPMPHLLLGDIELAGARFQAATKHYREALRRRPDLRAGHGNLGVAWLSQGEIEKAKSCFERVLRLSPDDATALLNLGNIAQTRGLNDQAMILYRRAIAADPNCAEAYNNAAVLCFIAADIDASIDLLQQALSIAPDYLEALNNLGNSLCSAGKLSDAIVAYRKAIDGHPEHAGSWNNLGNALVDRGNLVEGLAALQQAINLKPDYRAVFSNWLMAQNYLPQLSREALYQAHCQYDQSFCAAIDDKPERARHKANSGLRIGYVSPDFRMHSVAYFIEPILAAHNYFNLTVFCYSDVPKGDAITQRLQSYPAHWRDIYRLNDQEVCKRIIEDKIDILVDLAGHSSNNRLGVFAAKPVPVQVSYLGYPNTTGLAAMDYRLTDAWCDPEGLNDEFYTEELVRLPHGFLCYRPDDETVPISPLPALSSGHVTFGSFNNLSKITDQMIDLWCQVLNAVTNSRITLKAKALADKIVRERVMAAFMAQGIDRGRVDLQPQLPTLHGHLAAYNNIDIVLDTYPYNGTTTTFEALWMGVPTITLAGQVHAARVGVSILSRLGLHELIAETAQEYLDLAVGLSANLPKLSQWRVDMRQRMTDRGLLDKESITQELEFAYKTMWDRHCRGLDGH